MTLDVLATLNTGFEDVDVVSASQTPPRGAAIKRSAAKSKSSAVCMVVIQQ